MLWAARIGIRPAFPFFGQLNSPKHIFLIRHFYSFFLIPVLCLGYAEAFKHVQSDSQTSEWYSYFENDVPDTKKACRNICRVELIGYIWSINECLIFYIKSSEMDHHLRALILHSFIQKINCTIIFFHPDCTVGPGISPDHASRLAGFTAGRESHPALKISFCLF